MNQFEIIDGAATNVADEPDIVYLGMWQQGDGPYWYVSGQAYHSADDLQRNLLGFAPSRMIAVRIKIPAASAGGR